MKKQSFFLLAMVVLFVFTPWFSKSIFAGEVLAWGSNYYGQSNSPLGHDFVGISAGMDHSLALKSDGSLVAWGSSAVSDLPLGNDFVAISAGGYHSLALKSDASLVAWGKNTYGQCDVPTGDHFVAISAGGAYTLTIKADGSLAAWGYNGSGQCNVPTGNDFVAISAGNIHNIGLKSDGSLVAWGENDYGQCDVPAGTDFIAIDVGYQHSLALKSDGSLTAWGRSSEGQCNVPPGDHFVAISAGLYHNLALKSDGSVVSWGRNEYGECDVPARNDFVAISAGGWHSLALVEEPTPMIEAAVDIKPGSCPNPLNVDSGGVLPVAILGSEEFDAANIDPASIRLAGVAPIRSSLEDVATPVAGKNECECTTAGTDGYTDLTLKFKTQDIVEELVRTQGEPSQGQVLTLALEGALYDGTPIEGADCVVVVGKVPKLIHARISDVNGDGVVNMLDFVMLAGNWLESSVL